MSAYDLRKKYIVYIRLVLSMAVVVSATYYTKIFSGTPVLSVIFVMCVIFSNLVFIMLPSAMFKGVRLHYIIFVLDLAIILMGSYLFTRLDISLILAVFLSIFMAALSQSVGFSLLIALVVNAVYIFIKFSAGNSNPVFDGAALFNIPYIFIVSLHASYLAEKNNEDMREKTELEKIGRFLSSRVVSVKGEMSAVADFMNDVLQSFKYGVIILDQEGVVKIFNARCERIFGIKSSRVEGLALGDMGFPGDIKESIMNFKFNKADIYEKQLAVREKNCTITLSDITGRDGIESGILCVIREVNDAG
jgi:PAS domain-containing protein